MNSLRIGFIGITVDRWGTQMAEGALHDFEGWLVFMLSTAAVMLTAFALSQVGKSRTSWRDAFNLDFVPRNSQQQDAPQPALVQQGVPRPLVAAAVLVCVCAVVDVAVPAPQVVAPSRTSFYDYPTHLGDWVGKRGSLESGYLDALRLDDYVIADFFEPGGQPVNFYAAYYQAQDATRAIHSPHDCIPGGGWEITRFEQRTFPAQGGTAAFPFNRAVVQLGSQRQIVYYWFQERGRYFTSEHAARWYLFWDAFTRHRTDGALIRFVAPFPMGANEADVDANIMRLATQVVPTLGRYVPD
jgi:exosortase D (VPLPA-CTERM-specific)